MKKTLLLTSCFLMASFLHAQYTVNKKTFTDIGIVNNSVSAMALDSTKKIVIAGTVQEGNVYKLCFTRYTANSTPDSSFGNYGVDTFTVKNILPATYQGANLRCIAIQPDGKILAAGTAWYLSGTYYLSNVLVMRLNKNGTLDTAFGDNGTVRSNINSSTGLSVDEANSIQVQSDGKIVIAGSTYDYVQHRFLAIRYNTDGAVDNGFGIGGANTFAIGPDDDEAFALKVLDNGKIIIAGESYSPLSDYSYTVALVRLKKNGYLDTSFGKHGMVTTIVSHGAAVANAVAIQKDNKIVIAGSTQNAISAQMDVLCIRYNANGNMDSGFGNNGKMIFDLNGKDDIANNISIQTNDKILLGGYATSADSITEFMCIRLLNTGIKDRNFAVNGVLTTSLYHQGDAARGMGVLPSGKIVMAGETHFGAGQYISIVRYNSSGVIDSAFGNNGKTSTGIGSSEDIAVKILNSPWDKSLFVAGTANQHWIIAKYKKATLSLDSSFGLNGIASVTYQNSDPSDKIAFAVDAGAGKLYLAGTAEYGQATIVRFNKNGLIDNTFGKNGAVNYSLYLFYGGFGIAPDHKILLAGVKQQGSTGYDFLARFNANGTVDSAFGENGEVKNLPLTVNAIQVKQDNNNRLLLAGRVPSGFDGVIGVLCLKLNGTQDKSFGINGLASASKNANAPIYFSFSMAQDEKGRILVSGGRGFGDFAVVRFLQNGIPDSSFATNGTFIQNVSSGSLTDNYNEGISAKCKDAYCSVITSGIKFNDYNEQSRAVIIALKDDGSIDSLNKKGYIDTSFYNDRYEGLFAALIDTITATDEVIFVAGKVKKNSNGNFLLVKLTRPVTRNASALSNHIITDYKISIAPNPAHSNIDIRYVMPQAGKATINLTNFNGNILKSETQYCIKGKQTLAMQLPLLVPGVYFISIASSAGSDMHKIVVQ